MHTLFGILVSVIAISLAAIALRPLFDPAPARAQRDEPRYYIEPGTTRLRAPDGSAELTGKMVVDLETGDIWGFPTLTAAPYPIDVTKSEPPVSHPMYLGRFDFAGMRRGRAGYAK